MSNEAASCLTMESTASAYTYEVIETIDTLASRIEHITSTQCDRVALVTIMLFFGAEGKTSSGSLLCDGPFSHTANTANTANFLSNLRPLVRKTDEVFQLGNTLHFVLLGADLKGGQIVQNRLWDSLLWRIHNTIDRESIRPLEIASGYSSYPLPHQRISACIEAASEVSLHSNFTSERSFRKALARHARTMQQTATDEELPALARKLGIPYLSLLPKKRSNQVQQLVNTSLAQELHCYPVGRERNVLTVAMLNPQDRVALERLQQETGLVIFPVLTHPEELQTALAQLI